MIVRKQLDGRVVIRIAWRRMLSLLVVTTAVYYLYTELWLQEIAMSTVPASILGIALAILIGFRVNSAYERWWEARKIWGALVNDSRTFGRQVSSLLTPHWNERAEETIERRQRLIHGQIGFVHALRCALRGQEVMPAIKPFFEADELDQLADRRNIPSAILDLQAQRLREAFELGFLDNFRHMRMDRTLVSLCDSMGAAERIKKTVFPRQYSRYSTVFIKVYSYILPFILVKETGILSIPFTLVIGFIFFALDSIARGIENPFENGYNDIPLTAICNTIEVDLRQMLRETELPPPVEAVNGFLM